MVASGKLDMSSASPDRPLHPQRASLDRSGSFRENMENSILATLPGMSRSSSTVTQSDVLNFLRCLRFDPKSMVLDHKVSRQVEFKRLASATFGLTVDDSPTGSSKVKTLSSLSLDDLKRLKAGLRESSTRSRERLKIFSEALSVMNKCFPSIPSRKRSRSDFLPADRSNALFPGERSVLGSGMGKMGIQSHANASSFEIEQQKSEERTKISIPNKRTRTSVVGVRTEVRPNTPARPSGNMDRDREVLRFPSSGAVQVEERTLSIGVDGWEKSKMKKKRSGFKPDVSPGTAATKPIDSCREPKPVLQQRLLADARPRLGDSHGFRPGVANGAVGIGKADGTSQPPSLGIRSSLPKADQDSSSFVHDKRDRPSVSDKERVNLKAVSKTNSREEFSSASPTKMNSAARAPRSGSNILHKLSPIQRTTVANDWEVSHCTSKNPSAVGANNRKRTPSTRPSSPPVGQWSGQRPHKISRTARRTNFVPIVSSNDDCPALDAISDVGGNENVQGLARRLSSNSPQQVKAKCDHLSAALSESEESGVAEVKSRDKGKKADEMDEKATLNVQKVSTVSLPLRKNKLVSGQDLNDPVRRQGRTGRGFTATRSLMPMTDEKLGNVGTAKQLRSSRLGFDKTESKAGRPPTRKLSDRKAYTRQKHSAISAATAEFLVGSDDGHEELEAATTAIINPAHCLSSVYWRQMEPYFSFISDLDIAYLKQQGNLDSAALTLTPVMLDVDSFRKVTNGFGLIQPDRNRNEAKVAEFTSEAENLAPMTNKVIPLCQRLIAALISEEGNDDLCIRNDDLCIRSEDLELDSYGSELELDNLESVALNHSSFGFQHSGHIAVNGYSATNTERSLDDLDHSVLENNIIAMPEKRAQYLQNGLVSDIEMASDVDSSEFQYHKMSIEERVLLELHSVGLYPEPVPDLTQMGDEEVSEDICRLEDEYREKVTKSKAAFGKLLDSAIEMREHQEKEFEHRALDKLVAMAYEKYMACRGTNASGGKSASSKMAKQAALACVKRTLERCHQFEDTGKSCFGEPSYKDMFISGLSRIGEPLDTSADGESGRQYASTSSPLEVRVSAPLGTQRSPSLNNHDICSPNALLSISHSSEQVAGKEDTLSNRVKKRELLLDDVGGPIGTNDPSGIGSPLSSSAKGKRSERDRDGKVSSRDVSRNGTTKIGRPTSGNIKGERKSKTKPKQKTTQLSASVNGLLGKLPEQPKAASSSVPKSSDMNTSDLVKEKDECRLDVLDETEGFDLSHLQLPGMDVLGVPDDLGGQGQDLASWLNIDDDLQDPENYMGLEIPMDDLADLNMMV
ncbi:hypothetical protein NMG60_11013577 [Bertholletia excelsa]